MSVICGSLCHVHNGNPQNQENQPVLPPEVSPATSLPASMTSRPETPRSPQRNTEVSQDGTLETARGLPVDLTPRAFSDHKASVPVSPTMRQWTRHGHLVVRARLIFFNVLSLLGELCVACQVFWAHFFVVFS